MNDKILQNDDKTESKDNNPWEGVSQSITANQLADFYLTNMNKLDGNGNGGVTKEELRHAQKMSDFSSNRDQAMITKLLDNYDTLKGMTARGGTWSTMGTVAPFDMTTFKATHAILKSEQQQLQSGLNFVRDNFTKLDKDNNGYVSRTELQQNNVLNRPEMQQVVTQFSKIQDASNDEWGFENNGLSRKDLDKYMERWAKQRDFHKDRYCGCALCQAVSSRPSKGDVLKTAE